jgi:hypothetical protein
MLADLLSQLRDAFLGFGSLHRSFHDTTAQNLGNSPAMLAGNMPARAGRMPALPLIGFGAALLRLATRFKRGARAFCSSEPACCRLFETRWHTNATFNLG